MFLSRSEVRVSEVGAPAGSIAMNALTLSVRLERGLKPKLPHWLCTTIDAGPTLATNSL